MTHLALYGFVCLMHIIPSLNAAALTEEIRALYQQAQQQQLENITIFQSQIRSIVTQLHPAISPEAFAAYHEISLDPTYFSEWCKLHKVRPEASYIMTNMLILLKESGINVLDDHVKFPETAESLPVLESRTYRLARLTLGL